MGDIGLQTYLSVRGSQPQFWIGEEYWCGRISAHEVLFSVPMFAVPEPNFFILDGNTSH
jgi:hypothetical protein